MTFRFKVSALCSINFRHVVEIGAGSKRKPTI
jgi:hypothetical protein